MKLTYSVLAITAIVFSIMLILPSDLVQTADAAKASGVSIKKYGPETKHKVCGDRLRQSTKFVVTDSVLLVIFQNMKQKKRSHQLIKLQPVFKR
jgi:hypothetical protein